MIKRRNKIAAIVFLLFSGKAAFSQKTIIRGFADVDATYANSKLGFALGEEDLFITSELHDRISFLGESVFKYSSSSPTFFDVSIERIVLKYNFYGNHNIIAGKIHTPINYWNYTYHHGRVLFPTIERPLLFAADIIPLHTTGVGIQGQNLGKLKFGYDVFVGNGIGASEVGDNDRRKSVTIAVRINPVEKLTFGVSYYNDEIVKGARMHDGSLNEYDTKQHLFTGSVIYMGNKFELLAEGTLGLNHSDTTGTRNTFAGYAYAGYRLAEKFVPYIRYDHINYQFGEVYYHYNNMQAFLAGMRYEINYLCVVKLEYQHTYTDMDKNADKFSAQFAIGF